MPTQIVSQVPTGELDRRNSASHLMQLTAYNFVASVIILTGGMIFVNLRIEYIRITGGLYIMLGLLFFVTGILLVLTLITKKRIYSNMWFALIAFLVAFHIVDMGLKVSILVENGKKESPNPLITVVYAVLFALGYSCILIHGACIGIVLNYRSFHSQNLSNESEKTNEIQFNHLVINDNSSQ